MLNVCSLTHTRFTLFIYPTFYFKLNFDDLRCLLCCLRLACMHASPHHLARFCFIFSSFLLNFVSTEITSLMAAKEHRFYIYIGEPKSNIIHLHLLSYKLYVDVSQIFCVRGTLLLKQVPVIFKRNSFLSKVSSSNLSSILSFILW